MTVFKWLLGAPTFNRMTLSWIAFGRLQIQSLLRFICASLLSVIRPNLIFPNVILLCIIPLCRMSFWFVVCHSDPAACHFYFVAFLPALQRVILLYSISFCSATCHSALQHIILLFNMSFCSAACPSALSLSFCSIVYHHARACHIFYAILM